MYVGNKHALIRVHEAVWQGARIVQRLFARSAYGEFQCGAPTTDVARSRSRFEVLPVILPPQPLDATAAGVGLIDAPDPRAWLAAIIDGSSRCDHQQGPAWHHPKLEPGSSAALWLPPEEVIGKSITILIPKDRLNEEPRILAEIQRGRRILPFETQRLRKDGELVDISLTISPIHNAQGNIVGASKIARDITERRIAQEQQRLLMEKCGTG